MLPGNRRNRVLYSRTVSLKRLRSTAIRFSVVVGVAFVVVVAWEQLNTAEESTHTEATRLSNLLRGLKLENLNLTAIVTVADDGGSVLTNTYCTPAERAARTLMRNASTTGCAARVPSSRRTWISTPAIDMLMSYHWPGNVRELENTIERAVVIAPGDEIKLDESSALKAAAVEIESKFIEAALVKAIRIVPASGAWTPASTFIRYGSRGPKRSTATAPISSFLFMSGRTPSLVLFGSGFESPRDGGN